MLVRKHKLKILAGLVSAMLALSACGPGSETETKSDDIKAGPGVSNSTIKLAYLTDLSGPFGPTGKAFLEGTSLFVDEKNAAGGVCNRQIELVIEDHGYDVQKAVTSYRKIKDDVLAVQSILGGGMANALLPAFEKDQQLVSPVTWTGSLINGKNVFLPGADYGVQMANGISWAIEEKNLVEGDTVGFIGFTGEVGEAVLAGAKTVAEDNGMKVVETWIAPTDTDLTGAVSSLKSANAKVVAMITSPSQLATLVSTAESVKFDGLFVGPGPNMFDAAILNGPAKNALEKNVVLASGLAPWSADIPAAEKVRKLHEKSGSQVRPDSGIMTGYGQADVFSQVLEKACASGDLTRAGVLKEFNSMDSVDSDGLMSTLDFTRGAGKSQSLESSILRPNSAIDGGLEVVAAPFVSKEVKSLGF